MPLSHNKISGRGYAHDLKKNAFILHYLNINCGSPLIEVHYLISYNKTCVNFQTYFNFTLL